MQKKCLVSLLALSAALTTTWSAVAQDRAPAAAPRAPAAAPAPPDAKPPTPKPAPPAPRRTPAAAEGQAGEGQAGEGQAGAPGDQPETGQPRGGDQAPNGEEPAQEPLPETGEPPGAASVGADEAESSGQGGSAVTPLPGFGEPSTPSPSLLRPEEPAKRKAEATKARRGDEVFAEDWWSHARPTIELHGYYRLRAELFHRFDLNRVDTPPDSLWPSPLDRAYYAVSPDGSVVSQYGPVLCTRHEARTGSSDDPDDGLEPCRNKTQAGANMRFRLNPELHISDNLRVISQIDLLDNLVLGSTPQGYGITPAESGGYAVVPRGGYTAVGAFETTQGVPSAGVNASKDSIRVKRVWGEYVTPVGQLRFGRMPSHWGLGILQNSGDGYDDDYQTTVDRIMFVTGIKRLDLYFAGGWDFVNEGPTSEGSRASGGQPFDAAQLDDVDEYMLSVARHTNPKLTQLALSQNKLVLNGGLYLLLRKQVLALDLPGTPTDGAWVPGTYPSGVAAVGNEGVGNGYVRRGLVLWTPDLWLQLLYRTFRFEVEAVAMYGKLENLSNSSGTRPEELEDWKIRSFGIAGETEFRAVEDKLRLKLMSGWASGDPQVDDGGSAGGGLVPTTGDGIQGQRGDDTLSTFRFHPNYRVDLILNRNILTRVQGSYYVRPSVEYDFMRNADGQRLGGGAAAIWTRASSFLQTPGHERDLGIELNGKLYFQSKDGALNDEPGQMGGFYTQLEYGVLFPLAGLGYPERRAAGIRNLLGSRADDVKAAQILRWYIGVLF